MFLVITSVIHTVWSEYILHSNWSLPLQNIVNGSMNSLLSELHQIFSVSIVIVDHCQVDVLSCVQLRPLGARCMVLCVICSKKYGILFEWTTRVRGKLKGRLSTWLVGSLMCMNKRVLVEGSLVGIWVGKLKGKKLGALEIGRLAVAWMLEGRFTQ